VQVIDFIENRRRQKTASRHRLSQIQTLNPIDRAADRSNANPLRTRGERAGSRVQGSWKDYVDIHTLVSHGIDVPTGLAAAKAIFGAWQE
jgi:hypothetical protein